MQFAVAHQQKTGVVGHLPPLVKIEGQGIGTLNARKLRRKIRGQHGQCAEGAVDVETNCFALRQSSARAARSSIAPVSTVPALPTIRKGVKPLRGPLRSPLQAPGD